MTFDDVVDVLRTNRLVAVVTQRQSGEPTVTPIWAMVVDGVPYVRAAYENRRWWYRHALAGRPVAFVMGDGSLAETDRAAALELPRETVSAVAVPGDPALQDAIDAEILRKYEGSRQASIDAMLSASARAATLRIEPAR